MLEVASLVDLSQDLAGAQTLFGAAFQPNECLKALTFFEDGDLPSLTKAEKAALIDAPREAGIEDQRAGRYIPIEEP